MTTRPIPFRGLALRALLHVGVVCELHWFGTYWLIRLYVACLTQDENRELVRRCKLASGGKGLLS